MEDIASIVAALGGRAFLAERFGVTEKAIEQWEKRGRIPWKLHTDLVQLAAGRGVSLSHEELSAINRSLAA